jgi:hypothetical protein
MAKFYIRATLESPTRRLFVLAGSITEGEIKPGMLVHVPINSQLSVAAHIAAMESTPHEGGEDVCLLLSDGPEVEALRRVNIADELCEVTTSDEGAGSNAI